MNKKTITSIVVLLAILSVFAVYSWKESFQDSSKAQNILVDSDVSSIPIGAIIIGIDVTQTFQTDGIITGFAIKFATYGRENTCDVSIVLKDQKDEIVYKTNINAKQIIDNMYMWFYLDEPYGDKNSIQEYKIIVASNTDDDSNAITIWRSKTDNLKQAVLSISGTPQDGDLSFRVGGQNKSIVGLFAIITAISAITIVCVIVVTNKKSVKVENVFAVLVLCLGVMYSILLPPGVVPDEPSHISTVYKYSNALLGIDRNLVRQCDLESSYISSYPNSESYKETITGILSRCDTDELVYDEGYFVSAYPVSYIPPIIGITFARLLHMGTVPMLYMGRLFSLLFYAFMSYMAIKIIPFGKNVICVIALFPMALQEATSFSYDSFVNGYAFFLVGYYIYLAYGIEKIRTKQIIVLTVITAIFVPAKVVYVFMVLLFLLIPKSKFTSSAKYYITVVILTVESMVTLIIFNIKSVLERVNSEALVTWSGTPNYTIQYIIDNPLNFAKLVAKTLYTKMDFYIGSTVGNSLGWFQIGIPWFILFIFIGILFYSAMTDEFKQTTKDSNRDTIVYIVISIVTMASILFVMYLYWTPETYHTIEGVQGRYFIPILPMIIFAATKTKYIKNKEWNERTVFRYIAMSNIATIYMAFNTILLS